MKARGGYMQRYCPDDRRVFSFVNPQPDLVYAVLVAPW